ncbi:hypothetical protein, partial [Leptospira venezuelensis]|uniref:hypothetical protein n=1 Tax=Leptospira venezuelensis TaxID=1958811 RepID=UPI003004AD6F
ESGIPRQSHFAISENDWLGTPTVHAEAQCKWRREELWHAEAQRHRENTGDTLPIKFSAPRWLCVRP